MISLDTIRQFQPKLLKELKDWIETWLPPQVPFDADGFIRFDFDNQGGYLDITTNDIDGDGYGIHVNDDSGGDTLIETEESMTLQQNDGLVGIVINNLFSGITIKAGGNGLREDPAQSWSFITSDNRVFEVTDSSGEAWLSIAEATGITTLRGTTVSLRSAQKLQVKDSSGNAIFEVRDDGTVHIKTGGTVAADL